MPTQKTTLKIIFFTLFIDLIGFSIIFPLFPALLEFYVQNDSSILLTSLVSSIENLNHWLGAQGQHTTIVLFGGLLVSVYSFLQFLFAPVFGKLSDQVGRRPILLFCMAGVALSYLLWIFAAQFWVLIIARILGGIMGANLSTATAVVSDITTVKNRAKGMALIGIAFGLGFLIGPALGGLLSQIDLTTSHPHLIDWGINPFSMPALFAFGLSLANLILIITQLPETLPPEKRGQATSFRTFSLARLFAAQKYAGVTPTNQTYFWFILAFAGMEFSLTFLAVERFGYTSMQNAWMFVYVGIISALIQGGYVRRRAAKVGENKMVVQGLSSALLGLLLIGHAVTPIGLYIGLTFLAMGSALSIPCLTALISLYTPATDQGRILGLFRSLGALARTIGPFVACLLYWKLGSKLAYSLGGLMIIIPLVMAKKLPLPSHKS